jgi:hypothetical protein
VPDEPERVSPRCAAIPSIARPSSSYVVATVELMDLVDAPFPTANRSRARPTAATGYTRARVRLDHAGVLDHPGVVGARLPDPVEQKDNWPTVGCAS